MNETVQSLFIRFSVWILATFFLSKLSILELNANALESQWEYKQLNQEMENLESYATENNPLYLKEIKNIGMARGDVITASLYFNPTLAVQQQFIGAKRESMIGLPELYTTYEQPIDISGIIPQRKKVAMQDFQISISQFSDFDRLFRLRIRQNYLAYIYLTEIIKVQNGFLVGYQELLDLTKIRAEKGDISFLEYDKIELERMGIERDSKALIYRRYQVELQLGILLGSPDSLKKIASTYDLKFISTDELGLIWDAYNINNRPDYQALVIQENRERSNIELKKKEAVPVLNLGGETMQKGVESYYGVFASIPLPIYDRKQGEIFKAEEKQKAIKMSREAKKNEIDLEIRLLIKELKDRENQLLEYRRIKLLEKNKDVQEKSRLAYIRGAFNLITFLEAERNYLNVLRNHYELIYLYWNTLEEFKSSSGQTVNHNIRISNE